MAEASTPSSSSSSSSTSTTKAPVASTSSSSSASAKLSAEAQAIVDQLASSARVFVSKDDLSEDDEDALEAAGYAVDPDAVRNGYFVHRLSDTEIADRAAAAEADATS